MSQGVYKQPRGPRSATIDPARGSSEATPAAEKPVADACDEGPRLSGGRSECLCD